MPLPDEGNRDMVLPPLTYAFVQTENSGAIRTLVGPAAAPISGQDRPVRFDPDTRAFRRCSQEDAVCQFVHAGEGEYIILENPAKDQPNTGSHNTPETGLQMGSQVVIHGPRSFALWPGQSAKTIGAHHMKFNQFVLVRVYNEVEARRNWPDGAGIKAEDLRLGQLYIIRGDQRSFYMPVTGIEVVPDENGQYVRDAVTLEQLEYCKLVDENGTMRYERGPNVVFPRPTERFVHEGQSRISRARELTPLTGLHIKVIRDYTEGDRQYKVGAEQAVYFPNENHQIMQWAPGQELHRAIAIARGDGRYVRDEKTGEVVTVTGPIMLLPDPRLNMVVRRIVSQRQCGLWYPGNPEAAAYNLELEAAQAEEPVERRGVVTEASYVSNRMRKSYAPEAIERRPSQTPRAVVDSKFDGIPAIDVWTGYAVCVVNKGGSRRVVEGPKHVLLDYDETLEVLELSTGKPKTTDKLQHTVYLRVRNNKVSDIVELETADHVRVSVKLSMMVNFEGEDANRWFQVENYVKLLCDHVRSVFKGVVQRIKIEDFYSNYVPTIRDAILGASKETGRDGMTFAENGMRVKDVEVLGFEIRDEQVRLFLTNAQFNVVKSSIDTEEAERKAALATKAEEFKRQMKVAVTDTERAALVLEAALHAERHKNALAVLEANLAEAKQKLEVETATAEAEFVEHEWDLKRRREIATHEDNLEKAKLALRVQLIQQETAAAVERFNAAKGEVATAINTLADKDLAARIAESIGPMHNISGKGFAESLTQIFANLPIAGFVEKLTRGDRSLPSA